MIIVKLNPVMQDTYERGMIMGCEPRGRGEGIAGTPVAVVTGASRGLGRRTALLLGKSGYHVAVNYYRSPNEAREVAAGTDLPSLAVRADVGNLRDVAEMAETVFRQWGRVDVLINNAAITRDGLMMRYGEKDWDEVIRVNLRGCFNTVKSFAPLMSRSGGGHIINLSSRSGMKGKAGQVAYGAAKASLIGLTRTLARELAPDNIKVNCLLPGYMATEMGTHAKDAMKAAQGESILSRLSDPGEVAGFIAYLVGTETITGQVFCLDSRL
ncbi:MAG: SDR family oxidoreductase [Nitrospirae bacterium]|nr:SDR family oxidoreductase [Nitrospirota bacterium]